MRTTGRNAFSLMRIAVITNLCVCVNSVSTILDLDKSKPAAIQDGHSLLSVGHGGEVKRWLVRRVTQSPAHDTVPDFVWELVACFRTYSPDVSIATFEAPEFLFCGFDGGSFECWRLPSTSEKSPSRGLRSRAQTPGRISVVKRALHAIDLHLAPVRSILCESGPETQSPLARSQSPTTSRGSSRTTKMRLSLSGVSLSTSSSPSTNQSPRVHQRHLHFPIKRVGAHGCRKKDIPVDVVRLI